MLWALGTVREGVIAEEGGNAERCGNSVECLACFGNEKKEETLFLLFFADRTRLKLFIAPEYCICLYSFNYIANK